MNWVKTESMPFMHEKAIKASKKREKEEQKLLNEGKKKVLVPHPTLPKTMIEKFI